MGSDAEWSSSYSEEGTAARANSGHWSEIKIVPRIQNWKLWFAVPQTKIDLTRGVLTLACQGEGEVNVPLVRTICLFGHSCVTNCHWQFQKRKTIIESWFEYLLASNYENYLKTENQKLFLDVVTLDNYFVHSCTMMISWNTLLSNYFKLEIIHFRRVNNAF